MSNVESTAFMFAYSKFNGDISKWDVSSVKSMSRMFYKSNFNRDLSKWVLASLEKPLEKWDEGPLASLTCFRTHKLSGTERYLVRHCRASELKEQLRSFYSLLGISEEETKERIQLVLKHLVSRKKIKL